MGDDLAGVQALLYRLITAPSGVSQGLRAETLLPTDGLARIIASDERLSAVERLEIYANAYFYRLLDVFKEDYPAVLAVAGDANFHNLITGYLIEYPPTEPSVLYAGRHLPDFLRTHPMCERCPFLADLAALERSILEAFHAADADPLSVDFLRATSPDDWPAVRLQLHPATRLLDLHYPVDLVLRRVQDSDSWSVPERADTRILVYRTKSQVHHRKIGSAEYDALTLAAHSVTFGALCDAVAAATADTDPSKLINDLLTRWINDGVLTSPNSGLAPAAAS